MNEKIISTLKELEGKTFYYKENQNRIIRILGFDDNSVYLIDLDESPVAVPRAVGITYFLEDLSEEIVWLNESKEISTVRRPNKKQEQLAQRRWESIGVRWQDPEVKILFFNRKDRNRLIKKISQELNVNPRTTRTLLTRFWTGGMTRDTLIPLTREASKCSSNSGRKAKNGKGLKISKKEKEIFRRGYQRYHLREGKSIQKTFTCILKDNYSTHKKTGENTEFSFKDQEKTPTIDQFRYWVKTHQDKEKELISLVGEEEFNNSHSILTSSTSSSVDGAGVRAELDATHLPVEIVSEDDRSVCLGTPLLEILVDVYSKQIMGVLVTLENESYRTGALTILNAAMDKVEFAEKYNIHISQEDWPSQHLPSIILSDNGPFISNYNVPLEEHYHCSIESATARKGSAKGNVERKNRTFSDYIKETLPGAARVLQKGRGAIDLSKEACLTLREVTQIIIKKIIEYNHSLIKGYSLSPEAIRAGVIATPIDLWNFSIKQGRDQLIYVSDLNQLRIDLLPRIKGKRVIHRDGIHCNNFIYTSKDPEIQNWMINHMKERFDIAYDPIDIRSVYLITGRECIPLELNDKFSDFSKMSLEEVDYYFKLRNALEAKQKEKEELRKMETIDFEEKVIKHSKEQKQNKTMNKKKKINRREEVKKERIKEKVGHEKTTKSVKLEENEESKNQSEIYQKMIEKVIKKKTRKEK